MLNNLLSFWNGFTFDLLIGIISCLLGVIALIIGGTAYKNCKINSKTENNKSVKKIAKGADDHSNNSTGDMLVVQGNYYENNDNSLVELNKENFSVALNKAYEMLSIKCDDNLKQITQEAKRIVDEKKIELGSYTKLDWINIYFESAKNTSDTYMQNVWAKVLVQELSKPDSFSYNTLNILKNLSAKEFQLFENYSQYIISNSFIPNYEDLRKDNYVKYGSILKLDECGLINSSSFIAQNIPINEKKLLIYHNGDYMIVAKKEDTILKVRKFPLSSSATEILSIIDNKENNEFFIEFAKALKKTNKSIDISCYKITCFNSDGSITYGDKDVLL